MKTLATLILAAAAAMAADNSLTKQEAADGWRLLFDGKTFQGWQDPAQKHVPGDAWIIENGTLKTRVNPRLAEDLVTQESFGDFDLQFSWRVSPGGNTGIKYRLQKTIFLDPSKHPRGERFEVQVAREVDEKLSDRAHLAPGQKGAGEYTIGFEMQLLDDQRHPDAKRDPRHTTGALYSMISPTAYAAHPAGEWNEGRLVVRGRRVEHWVNGVKVLEGTLDSDAVKAGVMRRWGFNPTVRDLMLNPKPTGPICLQHHGDEVWFKNIRIRALQP